MSSGYYPGPYGGSPYGGGAPQYMPGSYSAGGYTPGMYGGYGAGGYGMGSPGSYSSTYGGGMGGPSYLNASYAAQQTATNDSVAQMMQQTQLTHIGVLFSMSQAASQTAETMAQQVISFSIQVWQNAVAQDKKLNQISAMAV